MWSLLTQVCESVAVATQTLLAREMGRGARSTSATDKTRLRVMPLGKKDIEHNHICKPKVIR
jgi:hypothetical protein